MSGRPSATNVVLNQAQKPPEKPPILTRSGYEVGEAFHAYQTALSEQGATAIGRAFHFAAELICSGGLDLWIKASWDHAIFHVGLASPRVFVYLKKRISELGALVKRLPHETLYKDEEFQTRISEAILILNGCPRRSSLKWPPVDTTTHADAWLYKIKSAPEVAAVTRIWKQSVDMDEMRFAAYEIVKCCSEFATEKALFWVRWLLEEDSLVRKNNQGVGLTTMERGPAHLSGKKRTDIGYYLLGVLAEVYKELAAKQLIRMHEEFQTLIDIWRSHEISLTQKQRREILGIMILIVAEVPRWKVPAAPALVKDPVQLSRAVGQGYRFFDEVLVYPPCTGPLKAGTKPRKPKPILTDGAKKQQSLEDHLAAYDSVVNSYLGLE